MHISISRIEAIEESKPDRIGMLPWNLNDEVFQADGSHSRACPGRRFVIPSPPADLVRSRCSVCGGLGTRNHEYSEGFPKPMIPVGQRPILWHIMNYYSHHGHRDLVLCLGYKANTIRKVFLNRQHTYFSDCIISEKGQKVELIGEKQAGWRVTLVDRGIWRNVGERLCAVREHAKDEEVFLANYSDGLSDVPLQKMIDLLKNSGKTACFLAGRPALTFHLVEFDANERVETPRASADWNIWINAGFVFRNRIFDYIKDGEVLVIEPFRRLIKDGELIAYRYTGFFRPMDMLKDRQILEEMVDRGDMPWMPSSSPQCQRGKEPRL
jgi:glucose-1-phosphate cytidylyltransferase